MNQDHKMMESRRDFLRSTSLILTGTTAFAMMPNFAWAQNDPTLESLAQVCYAMYPHRHVPRKYYHACAQGLLDKAAGDATLSQVLNEGLATVNAVYSAPFQNLSDDDQQLALQRIVNTPFFQTVRGHTVVGLYNIPGVWQYFGYQGPSFSQGGYLKRGFDDIFWLQDV